MEYQPMSAAFLKKRGYCCKSACLHCPYGFTLKKFGLEFKDASEDVESVKRLASKDIAEQELANYKLLYLKGELVGAMRVSHIQVKELFLKKEFQDQGLSLEIVESYYFY
ncbi:MAG: DUF5522 domain-containing protein [Bacteriovoracaceae bacterium]